MQVHLTRSGRIPRPNWFAATLERLRRRRRPVRLSRSALGARAVGITDEADLDAWIAEAPTTPPGPDEEAAA